MKSADLSPLMLNLELLGPIIFWKTAGNYNGKLIHSYALTLGLTRWKRPLVYLFPKLQHGLALAERFHRYCWSYMLNCCDQAHRSPHKSQAVMVVVIVFYGIKRLREMDTFDPAVTDHLQLALQDRLKIFCSRIFDFDASKRIMCDEEKLLAAMVGSVPELSSCLPPRYRHCLLSLDRPTIPYIIAFGYPETRLDFTSCLLRRSDGSKYCYDNTKTDSCCCGWTFDSIPLGFLGLFGHSASSFARYVHFGPREMSLGEVKVPWDPCQAINTVFGGPQIDDLSLRKRMMIFRAIMTFWLRHLFRLIDFSIENLDIHLTRKIGEIPEDQLDHLANNYRQRTFAHILRSAVIMYQDFWNSKREGETDAEDTVDLMFRFGLWLKEKRNSSEIEDFNRGFAEIHLERIVAQVFSDQDDSSDELEEGS